MARHKSNFAGGHLALTAAALSTAAFSLAGCSDNEADPEPTSPPEQIEHWAHTPDCNAGKSPPEMGLMTSLPLIWPLGAEFGAIARGEVDPPWQNAAIGQCFSIAPLDTLSPIAAMDASLPDTDPLSELNYLAVIQPRGLSPADNAALDDWVRAGGRLLLVLDPMLTGEYAVPLGDPRRPNDTALVPPVVGHWGLSISYDAAAQSGRPPASNDGYYPSRAIAYGEISTTGAAQAECVIEALQVMAVCKVGAGRVTLYADAAIFEDLDPEFRKAEAIRALMQTAFH